MGDNMSQVDIFEALGSTVIYGQRMKHYRKYWHVSLPVISTFRGSAPIGNVAPVWDGWMYSIKCVIKES